MGVFWADRPPDKARHLLSQTLYELRQELGAEWMTAAGEQLCATDELQSDVGEFVDAVETGAFESAIALYDGTFLGGASLGASRELEGWIDRQQGRLVRLHRQARRGLLDAHVESGRLEAARDLARAWVELDPLDDEAQHRLIELLAATGDRSGALRQYDRYARLVETELELEPLDQTRELVDRIREGDVGDRTASPATPVAAGPAVSPSTRSTPPDADGGEARADSNGSHEGAGSSRVVGPAPDRRSRYATPVLLVLIGVFIAAGLVFTLRAGPEPADIAAFADAGALNPRRIAVLYFQDLSNEQDLGYLAAGFTEALIHELSQVEELEVVSRTAVAPYRDMGGQVHDSIITHLAPGTLVEGSVTRVGPQLRLTVQLIDGATARHLLSRELHKPADSLTALLDALPREAALLLRKRLGIEIELRETRNATESGEAWALVQRAGEILVDARHIRRRDVEAGVAALDLADSLLVAAQSLDPDWPEPLLQRAVIEERRAQITSDVPSHYEPGATAKALAHLDEVLRRWPEHAGALAQRGLLRYKLAESGFGGDPVALYDLAESDLQNAVLLNGRLTAGWWGLSELLYRRGRFAEATRAGERAFQTDAFLSSDPSNLFHLFNVTFNAEEHRDAVNRCDELARRHPGTMPALYCGLILLTSSPLTEPDLRRARSMADSIVAAASESARPIYRQITDLYVARVLIRAGQPDSARTLLNSAVPGEIPAYAAYDVAHVRLRLGDLDGALEALKIHVTAYPGRAQSLAEDWWFGRLHGDPRFEALLGLGPG